MGEITFHEEPMFKDNWGWWFWDETWSDPVGPWDSWESARNMLMAYCMEQLEGQRPLYVNTDKTRFLSTTNYKRQNILLDAVLRMVIEREVHSGQT